MNPEIAQNNTVYTAGDVLRTALAAVKETDTAETRGLLKKQYRSCVREHVHIREGSLITATENGLPTVRSANDCAGRAEDVFRGHIPREGYQRLHRLHERQS